MKPFMKVITLLKDIVQYHPSFPERSGLHFSSLKPSASLDGSAGPSTAQHAAASVQGTAAAQLADATSSDAQQGTEPAALQPQAAPSACHNGESSTGSGCN